MAETNRILISEIRAAFDVISSQLEDGFIDFGRSDELEIGILRSAIAFWEDLVLIPREGRNKDD